MDKDTDFINNWIEKYIKLAADYMNHTKSDGANDTEADLVQALKRKNVSDSDIFLIIKGAQLLYNDRISVSPKKSKIKRL